jgi:hypothetical protein
VRCSGRDDAVREDRKAVSLCSITHPLR